MSRRGSIRKDASGRWCFVVDVPGADGKRKQVFRRGFANKKAAAAELLEVQHAAQHGTFVNASRSTFGDYLSAWLDALPAAGLKPSTYVDYRAKVERYVIPALGGVPLQELTATHLDQLYGQLLARPLSARTVRYVHTVIGSALRDAERKGLVVANVARRASPPSTSAARAPEPTVWTPEQLAAFLGGIGDSPWHGATYLAAMTGMRRGEVCGLRWDDVDLSEGVVQVRHTLTSVNGDRVEGGPKTRRGRRRVDLDAGTVRVLGEHRRRQLEWRLAMGPGWQDADGHVFTTPAGEPVHPDRWSRAFLRLVQRFSELPRIRLHDLRHTHATALLAAGVNPRIVADRLGHASVSFTLDTYGHVLPGQQKDAAEAVAALVHREQR